MIIVFAACPAENTNRTGVGDRRAVAQPRIRGVGHAGVPPVHLQRGHLGVRRRVLRGDGFPPGAERTIQRGSAENPTRAHRDCPRRFSSARKPSWVPRFAFFAPLATLFFLTYFKHDPLDSPKLGDFTFVVGDANRK